MTKAMEPAGVVVLITGAGSGFKQILIDSGMGGGQAFRMASDILFKINQAALADYNNYEAQLKANPKAYGLDEKNVNRSLMDPNFKLEKFEEFRKRKLEIYFKNVEARQGGE